MKSKNLTKNYHRKLAKADYRTFDDWKAVGRFVLKGQKSIKRDKDGKCLFHINQTTIPVKFMSDGKGNEDDGYNINHQEINDHFFADGYMDDIGDR